jgi:hypothetical protein
MHAHFPDPDKAVVYLDHFIRVVTQTTRANPGERSNTLKMVKYLRESIRTAIDPTNGAADPPQEAYANFQHMQYMLLPCKIRASSFEEANASALKLFTA